MISINLYSTTHIASVWGEISYHPQDTAPHCAFWLYHQDEDEYFGISVDALDETGLFGVYA